MHAPSNNPNDTYDGFEQQIVEYIRVFGVAKLLSLISQILQQI